MGVQTYTGKDLYDLTMHKLGGYEGAPEPEAVLGFLNEGKDAVWAILRGMRDDYFMRSSQSDDDEEDNYFAGFTKGVREYDLPKDCVGEVKFIEILTTSYEGTEFKFRDMNSMDWKEARRLSTADTPASPVGQSIYYYDIIAKRKMVVAQYLEVDMAATIWYVRWIPDFELEESEPLDEILQPYLKQISTYATKGILLSEIAPELWEAWTKEWKAAMLMIVQGAGPRKIGDPQYVEDFGG